MTASELLTTLKGQHIVLWVEGDRLRYRAPQGAMTVELQDTIRQLKPQLIDLLRSTERHSAGPLLRPNISTGDSGPLSFVQSRFWFFEQLNPGTGVFNVPFSLRLRGRLNVPALEEALLRLVDRHEILRTSFHASNGEPRQVVTARVPAPLPVVDLRDRSAESRAEELRIATQVAEGPFDVTRPPLWRHTLVQVGDEEYLLHFCAHHLICDGTSIGVLIHELTILYKAAVERTASPLPALPVQYRDFAIWQAAVLGGSGRDRLLTYWRKQLSGELAPVSLPLDAVRPAVQTYAGRSWPAVLDRDLTIAIKRLAQTSGATVFMVLLTAFKVLLSRLSGQDDIIVGTPVAGRSRPELEPLIGPFINTLPIRTTVSSQQSFLDLLRKVRESALGAYAHEDLPFEQIVEELHPARDLSRAPVFQVLFNMFPAGVQGGVTSCGVSFDTEAGAELSSKFDLTLYATPRQDQLELSLLYNPDLFAEARVAEMVRQLELLLRQATANPSVTIAALSLVTATAKTVLPEPRIPLTAEWPGSILDRVRRHAQRNPDGIAIEEMHRSIAYRELNETSDRLAAWLSRNGIGPQSRVAVYADRCANLVVALLGVMKTGAAFLVLDPAHPMQRLRACVEAARPDGWIELRAARRPDAALRELIDQSCRVQLEVPATGLPQEVLSCDATVPARPLDPDRTAYVAFTSGSTGGVKGIRATHRPLAHFLDWHTTQFVLGAHERFSLLSGLAHDPLLRDVFAPIWIGATLVVPDHDQLQEPGWLANWMRSRSISVAHLTPSLAEMMLIGDDGAASLPALAHVFFGGELLPFYLVDRLHRVAARARCINYYGATETPQGMAWTPAEQWATPGSESGRHRDTIPLGQGIDGVQILVLSDAGHLCGIGELGELVIRTPYLSEGYVDDDRLTGERFVINPFSGRADDRMYRTGDLGRYLPSGDAEFVGRRDLQVKIRGYRVELAEIEGALREHPDVAGAVVALQNRGQNDAQLVGYYVSRGPAVDEAALIDMLRARLPQYAIPSTFARLETIPLTPNGKIDRSKLPSVGNDSRREASRALPQTPAEEAIAAVFAEVLTIDRVGRDESFFALGGHSLAVTRLVARLSRQFEVPLPIRAVFESPTVEGLASRIADAKTAARLEETSPIVPHKRTGPQPLSFAQERVWFLQQVAPQSPAYNIASAIRITGALDVAAFLRSWEAIVARHEMLRARFETVDGTPITIIAAAVPLDFEVTDLRDVPNDQRHRRALDIIEKAAHEPFDLTRAPLFRVRLLRTGDDDHYMAIVMHHIVGDQASFGVLNRELTSRYVAFVAGWPAPQLDAIDVQYTDFTHWHRAWIQEEAIPRQLPYWKEQLAGLERLDLPADHVRRQDPSFRGKRESAVLPKRTMDALSAFSQREGVTTYMTLLAAFAVLVHRYTGRVDFAVGSPIANRTRVETERLIGMFVNTLVLRLDLSGEPDFREILRRVRERTLQAYANQDVPFERLVSELKPERRIGVPPLAQVLFNVQNAAGRLPSVTGLNWEPVPLERVTTLFDVSVSIDPDVARTVSIDYSTDLFEAWRIRRMIDHYIRILDRLIADPTQRVSVVDLMDDAERHQVLVEWNATAMAYDAERGVEQLVSAQARQRPDAVAVTCQGRSLTYAQLDEASNRVAHRLRAIGVEPNALVGVCMQRSLQLPTVLLGILKAGGAYVPLDPSFPPQRLSVMVEDSALTLAITDDESSEVLPQIAGTVLTIEKDWDAIRLLPGSPLEPVARGDDLAYVLYTSGSTGRPKGVEITRGNFTNFLVSMQQSPGLDPQDVLLAVTTLSFDIAGLELFLPLITGARIVLATRDEASDGDLLCELLDDTGATIMQATPATWRLLIDSGWKGSAGLKVLCGGEALSPELAPQILARCQSLWNMYGPTETTVWSTLDEVTPGEPITIGRPIGNTTVYVLTPQLTPVPVGLPGELYIGGDGVARGYRGKPDLTTERFASDPFAPSVGGRMYRTGDLARWLPDGRLQALGRMDDQVKVRGFRIELGEVEAMLERHETIRQAVATVQGDTSDTRRLVAYVVYRPGADATPSELRRFVRQALPDYMVPSLFVTMDALPLTPNGKVDRRALPSPLEREQIRGERVAPRTPMEQTVAEVWQELLKVPDVSVGDNFFELGGHSLLSVQAIAKLHTRTGVRLNPAHFVTSTLEQISATYEQMALQTRGT